MTKADAKNEIREATGAANTDALDAAGREKAELAMATKEQAATAGKNVLTLRQSLLAETSPEDLARAAKTLNLDDLESISDFGVAAQSAAAAQAEQMLEGIKNSQTGDAGDLLNEMANTMKGYDTDIKVPKFVWFGWFRDKAKVLWERAKIAISNFQERQKPVLDQLNEMADNLLNLRMEFAESIGDQEKLYDATAEAFKELGVYIAAGTKALGELDAQLKDKETQLKADPNNANLGLEVEDLREKRELLDRQVHDLVSSQQFARQQLPQIRQIQANARELSRAMRTAKNLILPRWKVLLAYSVHLTRQEFGAKILNKLTATDRQLMVTTAQRTAKVSVEIRRMMNEGLTEHEAFKTVNETVIKMITDIADLDAKAAEGRQQAEAILLQGRKDLSAAELQKRTVR